MFGKTFYATWRYPIPARYQALMDYLPTKKFGDNYDAKSDVRYFLERNPDYDKGHDLVCLMELTEDNMRSHTRRSFLEGLKAQTTAKLHVIRITLCFSYLSVLFAWSGTLRQAATRLR